MARIKTREVNKGTIKSLDRASSMKRRIKTASIRAKLEMVQERKSDENSSSFATDRIVRVEEEGAAVTGRATETAVRRAYRDYGEKKLRKKEATNRLRDKETAINSAAMSKTDAVEGFTSQKAGSRIKGRVASAYGARPVGKLSNKRGVAYAVSQRKKHAQRIMQSRAYSEKRRTLAKGVKGTARIAKAVATATKSMITAIIAAGSAAIGVIMICIFLSSAIYLFGQDTNVEYSAEVLGVGDTLIMRVASAQLGNVGGLKFCRWYGFSGRVEWCACFVSWCANQCGYIEKGIIPKFAAVGDGVDWFKARGRFQSNKYIPHPGDIIFFDWGTDGTRDHVGFVERCDGKMVYTIEGNSGGACKRLAYRVGHPEILGYGVPAYPMPQSNSKPVKSNTENKKEKRTTTR